jgi:hypothetical protein
MFYQQILNSIFSWLCKHIFLSSFEHQQTLQIMDEMMLRLSFWKKWKFQFQPFYVDTIMWVNWIFNQYDNKYISFVYVFVIAPLRRKLNKKRMRRYSMISSMRWGNRKIVGKCNEMEKQLSSGSEKYIFRALLSKNCNRFLIIFHSCLLMRYFFNFDAML